MKINLAAVVVNRLRWSLTEVFRVKNRKNGVFLPFAFSVVRYIRKFNQDNY